LREASKDFPRSGSRRSLLQGQLLQPFGAFAVFRLVYPAPEAAGLGVHLTLDLAGQARFGPDVEWIERVDYDVDAKRAEVFYGAIRSYWPGLPDGALQPAYSGIRPKLQARGQPASDFLIRGRPTTASRASSISSASSLRSHRIARDRRRGKRLARRLTHGPEV